MMKTTSLNILCKDVNVIDARKRAVTTLPDYVNVTSAETEIDPAAGNNHLIVPCSPTGEVPATHWYCYIKVTDETYQKMLDNQLHTIIEKDLLPSEFLADHGLKRIRTKN